MLRIMGLQMEIQSIDHTKEDEQSVVNRPLLKVLLIFQSYPNT